MPKVRITLNDGSTRDVQFEDGFTDADIEEVAGSLNAQLKPVQQKAVENKPAQQFKEQPQKQNIIQEETNKPLEIGISKNYTQNWDKNGNIYYTDEEGNRVDFGINPIQKAANKMRAIGGNIKSWVNETNPDSKAYKQKANAILALETLPYGLGEAGTQAIAARLTPYVGRKIAKTTAQGIGSGLVGGGAFGGGNALIEGENIPLGILGGAAFGGLGGGLIGGLTGKVGKAIAGNKLSKLPTATRADKRVIKPVGKQQIHRLRNGNEDYLIAETNNGKKFYISRPADLQKAAPEVFAAEAPNSSGANNIINDVSENFNPSEKITKKSLENQAKQLQNEIKDLQADITPKTNIAMSKKGQFWSKNIDDDMTRNIRSAEEELNNIIKEIQKNPEIVNDSAKVEALESKLSNKLGIADEVDTDFYNKFYAAVNKANEVNETLALAGDYTKRGLPSSILKAKGTPKEVKEIIKNDFPEYKVMHNNELTEQAVQEVESNFNNELSRLTSAKDFEAIDYEKSRQIAKRLFDMGRHEEAVNLIDNVSENATKKGQAIQALSLWSNMTPEGAVFKAEKLVKEFNKKVPARKQVKLTPEQIEKIRQLQTEALNATDDLAKAQGIARTAKFVSELVPKNLGQKLKTYRNISLLLNPKTLGRNIIGNTLFNAVDTVSKAAAVPFDRAIGLVTGNKTRVAPQITELVKGGLKGAKTGFKEALEGIDTRGLGKRFDLQSGRTFKNPLMQKTETALDIGLRVPDRTQYEATFAESVANMMKAQGLSQPTQEILEQAEKEALESVFQNDSVISGLTTKVRRAMNTLGTKDFGLGDLAIPYAQTPANLVQQAINYSPAGVAKGINNLLEGNQRQASLDFARALVGSGIIGGSYGLSQNGTITPSQFDENYQKNRTIKANLATMGIKPETINGLWYAPFQPMSTSVAIGNAMASGENPLQAGVNTMLDLPFLQNVNRGLADIKDKGIAQAGINFASSLPAQFVPTVGSQIGQVIDPYQRETYDPNVLKRGVNQAVAKIPFASQTLPEKFDVQGKPVQRYTTEGVQRMFDIFLNPTYINQPINDTVMNELKILYDETGDTKQFLPIVDKKISYKDANGENVKIELTGEQFSNYQKVLGSRLYREYAELMQTNRYKNADDNTRIELLNKGKQKAKNEVDAELFNKPLVGSRKKMKDPSAKLKRLQNKIDKQLIDDIFSE